MTAIPIFAMPFLSQLRISPSVSCCILACRGCSYCGSELRRTAIGFSLAILLGLTAQPYYIVSADGLALSSDRTLRCCPLLFFGMALWAKSSSFFRCKDSMQPGATLKSLDQWHTAPIFLYPALRFCLWLKIKSIDALSLVHPFSAPTF